jgi:RNA polymerase sigma-70 factor (ECF subfamily)
MRPSADPDALARVVAEVGLADGPTAAAFQAHLVARGIDRAQVGALADLYLAFACASGSEDARRRIAEEIWRVVVASQSVRLPDATVDDARQIVFERLVAADDPKIASYDGRGPLGGWLRVVVAREALALSKRRPQHVEPTNDWADVLADIAAPSDSPELSAMKTELSQQLRESLRRAARALSPRDRALLRQHLALGMSVDVLAPVHGAHRATVARWIVAAKDALVERFHAELQAITGLRRAEVASLQSLVSSRLDISLASVFATVRETRDAG